MIRFVRPTVPEPSEWLAHLAASLSTRTWSNTGPAVKRLESELAGKFARGQRSAVTACNATAGLVAALGSLGVSGRVVIPSFTFPATGQAVLLARCEPVFCDVSPASWELDVDRLEQILVSGAVSAVVYVRAFGFCRELADVSMLARTRGVPLIIDAAAALGGRTPDHAYVGNDGDVEVFSMHATKVFNVGEGGVVFVAKERVDAVRSALNFGIENGDVVRGGLNGKLSDLHAAVGLAVLDRIDSFVARRSEIVRRYRAFFGPRVGFECPEQVGLPPWQTFPVAASSSAGPIVDRLKTAGLEARRYYVPPLHRSRLFAAYSDGLLPVSEELSERVFCLPVYSDMTDSEYEEIESILRAQL